MPDICLITSIKSKKVFRSIASKGLSVSCGSIVIKALGRDDVTGYMVAYVVNRKVGCAVVRNLIKRRLRVIMREVCADGVLPLNFYYLIISRYFVSEISFKQLRRHMHEACNRIRCKLYEVNSGSR